MACSWKQKSVAALVIGVLVLGVGVGLIPLTHWLIHSQISQKVILKEGTEFYKLWTDIPYPIYMQFYMFDTKNPKEVENGGKPYVEERGPYTYREYRIKENLTHNDNGTLTYRQKKYWTFVREMSVGEENDTVTTPNFVLLSLAESFKWQSPFIQTVISLVIAGAKENLFYNKTVKELIWGYKDNLLSEGQAIDKKWFYTNIAGYFAGKNNSYDGTYTVFTGENDLAKVGVIDKFNGSSSLSYWSTQWANMINGTDGTVAPPFLKKDVVLHMFSTDICRSVYGVYSGDVYTSQGIHLHRYSSTANELANVSVNPDNLGFCTPQTNCLPSGLLNITQCQLLDGFHGPVIVSFPHFYMADEHIVKAVDGMNPNAEWHRTDVDVEPYTGAVLEVSKRLQINLYMLQMKEIQQLKNIRNLTMPVMWINESAVVDDKTAAMLKSQLFVPLTITQAVQYSLIAVGSFVCFVVILFLLSMSQESQFRRLKLYTSASTDDDMSPIISESNGAARDSTS